MGEWQTRPLGSLVDGGDVSYGIVQPGNHVDEGTPIVRVKDLRGGRVATNHPLRVAHSVEERYNRTRLQGGELLLSLVGSVGESAVVPTDLAGWNVARAIAVVRPAGVTAQWLHYCFRTRTVQHFIDSVLNTTVQSTLNLADVKRVPVPTPPRTVQQAIADVLGALDDKIAANHRVVRACDAYAEALTLASLDGDEVPLAETADITMGSSPPGSSYNELGEGLPFYQGVRDFGTRFPGRRIWTTEPVRVAETGDTLVSVRAPVGRTNMASEEMCLGRGIAGLSSAQSTPMTLFHRVRAAHSAWAPYEAEGTVFGSINKKQLEQIPVPTVRFADVDRLEQDLVALERRLGAALRESASLASTRDELLPLLMSGRLRVTDAEQVVSDAT